MYPFRLGIVRERTFPVKAFEYCYIFMYYRSMGYFRLDKSDSLGATFTRVAQELHSQYVLGFAPTQLDGRVHKLAVRIKQPGMVARNQSGVLLV